MSKQEIKAWLSYFKAAKMVNFKEIFSLETLIEARKYCKCLRVGVFAQVEDNAIWYVIREYGWVEGWAA
jgi:hypothetical protein